MVNKQLRYFVVLAEELHFGRAASRLHISQPPLSQTIKALEADLGVRLLERGGKQAIKLTPAGATLLNAARRMLQDDSRMRRSVRMAHHGETGILKLGHTDDFAFSQLSALLMQFHARYPELIVSTQESYSPLLARQLNDGAFDCIFTVSPLSPALADCHSLAWQQVPIVALVPAGHRLSKRKRIKLREIAGEKLLTSSNRHRTPFEGQLATLVRKGGLEQANTLEFSSPLMEMQIVQQGYGIALATRDSIPATMPGLVQLGIDDPDAHLDRAVVWREDNANPALARFLESVKSVGIL